jgi:AcrR family transcriptional regulator
MHAKLLAAARAVFADKGYVETTIPDILDRAGVARGTLYAHFTGKRELLGALMDVFLADLHAVMRRVDLSRPEPPRDQLLGNIERALALLAANVDLTRLVLQTARGFDDELDERLASFDDRVMDLLTRSLETGVLLGLVRPGPTRLRAAFVLGAIKEAVGHVFWREGGNAKDLEALAREILDFATRGLLTTHDDAGSAALRRTSRA